MTNQLALAKNPNFIEKTSSLIYTHGFETRELVFDFCKLEDQTAQLKIILHTSQRS